MASLIRAVYDHEVFRPNEPVQLDEGAEVEVFVVRPQAQIDASTGWEAIDRLVGRGRAVAPDVSENHDRYLVEDSSD